jgi:hypothetical protein
MAAAVPARHRPGGRSPGHQPGLARVLLAGEPLVTGPFRQQLPGPASAQVAATVDANLIWEDHAAVAERLDDALRDAALQQARALAGETIGALTRAVRRRSAGRRWPTAWCSTGSAT